MVKKGKRPAPTTTTAPSKKRKLSGAPNQKSSAQATSRKPKVKGQKKGKEKAADRETIPIPNNFDEDDEVELSDQDLELLETYGGGVSFLNQLDHKGIARSKKETERLHALHKPVRQVIEDDLPSIDSHDEDEEDWSSGVDDLLSDSASGLDSDAEEEEEDEDDDISEEALDSDEEMPYEKVPRIQRVQKEDNKKKSIPGLPIKLADGRIQQTGTKVELPSESESSSEEESEEEEEQVPPPKVDDVSTGARFGRPAVMDVIGNSSKKARLNGAKDQIANICQEIVSDPENSLGLLRRLHVFSQKEVTSPSRPEPIPNDPAIRKLAILSRLAVFKDILPGYRIRPLTEKEKTEKVSQIVARTRDWEQGLVSVYQTYLRSLEAEIKDRSELAELALKCMCTLLKEATHFNFRTNLMACIVTRLSRKSWDNSSELCLQTIIHVFREDLTGEPSLEIVRLLNRMVKERKYNVRPEGLSCLLHLRLKTELNIRASETRVDKENSSIPSRSKAQAKRAKGKKADLPHLSKKAKKAFKEKQEIDKEMREAEAEVDKEERAKTQTEALKLVFVLYFSILKNSKRSPLLSAALQGISRFAHLINIDFFKDLMEVLKDLIEKELPEETEAGSIEAIVDIQQRLLCIVTAFELLTGQGEALNIDLSGFIKHLYAIILPLSLMSEIDTAPPCTSTTSKKPLQTTAELLFRALNLTFSPRATAGQRAPTNRSAAFCKRLLVASLNWPPKVVIRTIEFVLSLVARDPKLEGMLSTEDRMVGGGAVGGGYRWDVDDPEVVNPFGTGLCWEVELLRTSHWDANVRKAATKLVEAGSHR